MWVFSDLHYSVWDQNHRFCPYMGIYGLEKTILTKYSDMLCSSFETQLQWQNWPTSVHRFQNDNSEIQKAWWIQISILFKFYFQFASCKTFQKYYTFLEHSRWSKILPATFYSATNRYLLIYPNLNWCKWKNNLGNVLD